MQNAKKLNFESNVVAHGGNTEPAFQDLKHKMEAIDRALAVIEFSMDGIVETANENFLKAFGYSLGEIVGQHHRMFCDPDYVKSQGYSDFWRILNQGQFETGEYRRFGRGGREIWIQATYHPVLDEKGHPYKVVKIASDVSAQKLKYAEYESRIMAISKSQAVIEFSLDGIITDANENFLQTLGYTLDEVKGRHHRMFCDPDHAQSMEYRLFWEKLARGEFDRGEYKRIAKGGREVWISASYNPILDMNGRPVKIVKYATDISQQKLKDQELLALSKTQAVISFDLDGTVLEANDNFLACMGYRPEEIRGQHHSMFCASSYANSAEYREFWAKLNSGRFVAGQFPRQTKDGREIWLQASYNPVFDLAGKVFKVVKYATDITQEKEEWFQLIRTLGETADQLAAASEELTATATQFAANTRTSNEQSLNAAAASEEVSKGVQSVSMSMSEIAASIAEISRSTTLGSEKNRESLKAAEATSTIMNSLGESSQEIGSIVKVISSIAQQTNLLALNATIEAARAGDAGRGFAVVANEVKELARQTAHATEEISQKVSAIQDNTSRAVTAIAGISRTVSETSTMSVTIASAVEEQTATITEVSRVVTESSLAVNNISNIVKDLSRGATEGSQGASQLLDASKGLSELASHLKTMVARLRK
jgi:methyl-accepting chemotaxis protein